MKHKVKKAMNMAVRTMIKTLAYVNTPLYMKALIAHYKSVGMNIVGKPTYINSKVYFDGSDYSLITIGNNVSISREVFFLTHDLSMNTIYKELELANKAELDNQYQKNRLLTLKPISIDDNSFIGARVTLLPGTRIGKNCLIGAGSVVRGHIPDGSIAVGNPATVVKNTREWLESRTFGHDASN